MADVKVYSTKNCPYCRMTKAFLKRMGVLYEDIDVGSDPAAAEEMVRISGQRGVPVTVFGDEIILGFDAKRLKELFGREEVEGSFDILIVGGGPAGLTAAVYCARKMLRTGVITESIGGQALESWAIENYMGYRMVTGEELMKKFEEQVRDLDIYLTLDKAVGVSRQGEEFAVTTISGAEHRARALILASGRRSRRLGIGSEDKFWGRGVSVCATCDGPLYQGKNVAVVGGGNSALTTAIEMGKIANSVKLIVRSEIRADDIYLKLYEKAGNIETFRNYVVSELDGDDFITGMTITERDTGEKKSLAVDGVFLEIGQEPNTEFLNGMVALNQSKEVIVDENCHTSVEGIYAAGDISSIKGKQVIIAAGEGAKAALEAQEFLLKH